MLTALIVNRDASLVETIANRVCDGGFEPSATDSLEAARAVMAARPLAAALLLRVLEARKLRRVGGEETIDFDLRSSPRPTATRARPSARAVSARISSTGSWS